MVYYPLLRKNKKGGVAVNNEAAQFKKMTETPVKPLIASLAVPTIISMLITAIYNTADTFFVAKISTAATAAAGLVFSLMTLVQAFGFTFGLGAGSLISRLLGRREADAAERFACSALAAGVVLGILFAVFGNLYLEPIVRLLGADDGNVADAMAYGKYILIGMPASLSSFILNNLLRAEGKAKFALIGIMSGGILNVALDPLLIFTFKMGTAGAAVATAVCQLISCAVLLTAYFRGKTILKLRIRQVSLKPRTYGAILKNGMPSLFRQGLSSIATIMLNRYAAATGALAAAAFMASEQEMASAAVAAMSIVTKVFMAIFSAVIGFGQGYQPVAGYNYGANKFGRVREAAVFMWVVSTCILTALGGLCFWFAPEIIHAFRDDPNVVKIGTAALRAQCFCMPLLPIGVTCNMSFQSIGKPLLSTITSSMRQGLFFIPLILILAPTFGLTGVEYTQAAAEVLTAAASLPFLLVFLRRLKRDDKAQQTSE